ncbi:MAG: hypothetical protein ACETWK_07715 [Candidatus Aminicenantaceae bacterium]
MKRLISILVLVLLLNNYSVSQFDQKDIIERADLLLDMMEFRTAIVHYLKILSQNPQ